LEDRLAKGEGDVIARPVLPPAKGLFWEK